MRSVEQVAPSLVRITFGGADFADFVSAGPADHIRIFFPDPHTGRLNAPAPVGPNEDGIVRPEGAVIARDFTPIPRRVGGGVEVDVDFFLHSDPGPASSWAEGARAGDELVIVGPRGSRRAPQNIDGLLLVADETSLPSARRWVRAVPAGTRVDVIAAVSGDGGWVREYLGDVDGMEIAVTIVSPDADGTGILEAIMARGAIDEGTFVWAAGEAPALIPVRRHLRRGLALAADQAVVSGYWRRGDSGFDHHGPIDPSDPD